MYKQRCSWRQLEASSNDFRFCVERPEAVVVALYNRIGRRECCCRMTPLDGAVRRDVVVLQSIMLGKIFLSKAALALPLLGESDVSCDMNDVVVAEILNPKGPSSEERMPRGTISALLKLAAAAQLMNNDVQHSLLWK